MSPYLFDTDTLSEIIRPPPRRSPLVASRLQTYLRSKQVISFSEVSVYEILRGFRQKQAQTLEANFRAFCQQCRLCPISIPVLERAADLWAVGRLQGKVVGDNDLIIAATALNEQLPLVTANTRHFDWIAGLSLVNWRV